MIVWLVEFAISIAVGAAVVYFFFLTNAPQVAGSLPVSSSSAKRRVKDCESVSWLSCIEQWLCAVALGGGCADSALWSSQLAYNIDSSLARLRKERSPSVHLEAFTFADGCGAPRFRGVDKEKLPAIPLPMITSVRSHVSHGPEQSVTRELTCSLRYMDASFHLRINCEAPLLGSFPAEMRIPANLLSLKGVIDVHELVLEADVCFRLCGRRAEIFFPGAPHVDSKILAFPSGSRRSSQTHLPMEVKAGELVRNSIRVALENLVFPQVLVLTVHSSTPFLRWNREQLDSASH